MVVMFAGIKHQVRWVFFHAAGLRNVKHPPPPSTPPILFDQPPRDILPPRLNGHLAAAIVEIVLMVNIQQVEFQCRLNRTATAAASSVVLILNFTNGWWWWSVCVRGGVEGDTSGWNARKGGEDEDGNEAGGKKKYKKNKRKTEEATKCFLVSSGG